MNESIQIQQISNISKAQTKKSCNKNFLIETKKKKSTKQNEIELNT